MQVKKFEAKTMKEALELVRTQLGPDAVILRARDTGRGFGLMGEKSVEVTAAVSETTLRKKQFAESRLSASQKEILQGRPARIQKEFIEKSVSRYLPPQPVASANPAPQIRTPVRRVPYAQIGDDEDTKGRPVQDLIEEVDAGLAFEEDRGEIKIHEKNPRIQNAIKSAARAFDRVELKETPAPQDGNARTIRDLQDEVQQLRRALEKYREAPRTVVSAHPGAEFGLPYEVSFMFERLRERGISEKQTVQLLRAVHQTLVPEQIRNRGLVEAAVARKLLADLHVSENPLQGRVHIFAGGPGEGKTSSLAKVAAYLAVRKKKKIVLVSADAQKVGASEQLRIYAQILNGSFALLRSREDWGNILAQNPTADMILVDAPGSVLRSEAELQALRHILPPETVDCRIHLVQSLVTRDEEALELARRYRTLGVDDVIFTKLDLAVKHGLVASFHEELPVPILGVSTGGRIPSDFELAQKEKLLNLILKITPDSSAERSLGT